MFQLIISVSEAFVSKPKYVIILGLTPSNSVLEADYSGATVNEMVMQSKSLFLCLTMCALKELTAPAPTTALCLTSYNITQGF
jgi:hypothetical protein